MTVRGDADPAGRGGVVTMTGPEVGSRGAGDHFLSLLLRVPLTRREQRVALAVLLSPTPLTALAVAKQTRLAYSHTKAIVRTLVTWGILIRRPDGLYFQPDPGRWQAPPDRDRPTPRRSQSDRAAP
ncbi:MAG: hypothetical protein DME09_05510 [Candidatus Rokuibacteriota bacterium]|nr:MAG: hypothetical protein DME09_05510 [Candidatus Rokubacteria bacterium]